MSLKCLPHLYLQEQVAYDDPDKKIYHLCIVNLVIGLVSLNLSYC